MAMTCASKLRPQRSASTAIRARNRDGKRTLITLVSRAPPGGFVRCMPGIVRSRFPQGKRRQDCTSRMMPIARVPKIALDCRGSALQLEPAASEPVAGPRALQLFEEQSVSDGDD